MPAVGQLPVPFVEQNVTQEWRDRPALRYARGLREGTLHYHPGAYPQTQQPDHPPIADPAACHEARALRTLDGLGGLTPYPVTSALRHFRDDFEGGPAPQR